jgi:acyl-homoserine lactone acylase PvdQ
MNYLTALGRTAEAEGEAKIWQDLRQRLFLDPEDLKKDYAQSPEWLRQLMDAWPDGIDFYLATHPDVKPRVLTHFEPWMALSFTEGSVGGDIERVDLKKLQAFYDDQSKDKVSFTVPNASEVGPGFSPDITSHLNAGFSPRGNLSPGDNAIREPGGSNGIAIAPSNTRDHHALLLINPHTSFFFRSELQMSSDEGLNAYGAVTWGQFFIYQGFNARAGWMHTSSNVDAVDEFVDTLYPPAKGGGPEQQFAYRYGNAGELLRQKQITLSYKATDGLRQRTFTTFYDRRGPIVRRTENNKWISISLMNIPIPALEQSYLRTKATSYAEYKKTMALMANSSNNTIFADADGDIAYWHGNFIPRHDIRLHQTSRR